MSNTELVEVDEATTVASNTFEMVDVESAKAFMENYQEVVEALLDPADYQKIGGKPFKKKSAWRKLQTAFNISDEIVKEETVVDDNNQIISSKFYVKATMMNGRSSVGVGACSIFDKITKKDKSQPSNFVLRNRFNNAEHDVPSTAHTRAKSRAIADLIGAGEVSAEEMEGANPTVKPKKSVTPKKPQPAKKVAKPSKDDEAIEVEVVAKKKSKSLKDLIDENKTIREIVDELQSKGLIVNRDAIKELGKNKLENKKITKKEYESIIRTME